MTTRNTNWLDLAGSLAAVIGAHRDESEEQRRMAESILAAVKRTGICDMLVPSSLGGPQADYGDYLRTVEAIARLDGSTAWNVMIWAAQGAIADYMPEAVAREVLQPGGLVCGAITPSGAAREAEGGFTLSGRWSFASGSDYATFLVAGCVIIDGEAPRLVAEDVPDLRLAILPAPQCQIIDTWHTAGLRGTGSHDFVVNEVFVPAGRMLPLGAFFTGPAPRPDVVYTQPFYDLASPQIATVALGIARDAIESFIALAGSKTPAVGCTPLADLHTVQQAVGRAEALLRSARVYLYETLRQVMDETAAAPFGDEHRAALRLASSHSAQCAVEAVDLMFNAAGSASLYASSRLERCFRDVHMVTHHMMAQPLNVEMVGRYLLGGPMDVRR